MFVHRSRRTKQQRSRGKKGNLPRPKGLERLEDRILMAGDSSPTEFRVNLSITRGQVVAATAPAVDVSALGESIAVFAGRNPEDGEGVFGRRFDASGAPAGPDFRLNETTRGVQAGPTVSLDAQGSFVAAWQGRGPGDHDGIFVRLFTAAGVARTGEILANSTTAGDQVEATLAHTPDGGFIVAWSGNGVGDFDGIFWRRFTATGQAIGAEQRANSTTLHAQAHPSIAAGNDGSFVIVWSSRHQDGSDWGVFGQRFDANGNRVGSEFPVNSQSSGSQLQPSVAFDALGNFAVAWHEPAAGPVGWRVSARLFDAAGNPRGGDLLVDGAPDGIQKEARLAMASDGSFLVTWTVGVPNGSGWEVVGRIFAPDAVPQGDAFPVNVQTSGYQSGHQTTASAALAEDGSARVVWSGRGEEDRGGVYTTGLASIGGGSIQIAPIEDQTIDELSTLAIQAVATASSGSVVTYSFERAPTGATIDPATGAIAWMPTESQGFGVYPFTVVAAVAGAPTRSVQETFIVTVREVNQAPVLAPIGNRWIAEEQLLTFTASATDADLPEQRLVYRLDDGAPAGATIDPLSGVFRWNPTETQGPGDYPVTVIVTDLGNPEGIDQETITITVGEVNRPPVLSEIGNLSIPVAGTLVVALTATDPDLPANALTYRADELPDGATLDTATGIVRWMPTEAQANLTFSFTITVLDNGTPQLSDTITFQVTVEGENEAPQLTPLEDVSVDEAVLFTLTAVATDPNDDELTYSLEDFPAGAAIDPQTGVISWTPTEAQGPGDYVFTVVVSDDGNPALTDSTVFVVTVREVNLPPVIAPIADLTIDEESPFQLTVVASDPDLPENLLTFELLEAPEGGIIHAESGEITWTPSEGQGPGEYLFRVQVTDNGEPPLTAVEEFTVTVREVNQPPLLTEVEPQTIRHGEELTVVFTAIDADIPLNALTFEIVGDDRGATIIAGAATRTAEFRWAPGQELAPGIYEFLIRVSDDGSPLASDQTTLTVEILETTQSFSGWIVTQDGGTPGVRGGAILDETARLLEGDSFRVSLERVFMVPAGAMTLSFEYADLNFDTTDASFINDAFEVALVDSTGASLVPTYTGTADRDAFFNVTEEMAILHGTGVTVTGNIVTLSLAGIAVGTHARLIFRLANNDTDNDTSVQIVSVTFPEGATSPEESSSAKFFVVDAGLDSVFRYSATGNEQGAFVAATGAAANSRGISSSAAGDLLWTVDGTTFLVSVYGPSGAQMGAWEALQLISPEGITVRGDDLWIVDASRDAVLFFPDGAVRRAGAASPVSSFLLELDNGSPSDLVTDGTTIWVTDDVADKVFVYSLTGTFLGSWALDAANSDAAGITLDPTGAVSDLWTVDRVDGLVYRYADSRSRVDGSQNAVDSFALVASNLAPEGIADPPVSIADENPLQAEVFWHRDTFTVLPESNQVMMTPAVLDLNADGVPDIIFSTYIGSNYFTNGTLRAIRGSDGSDLWTVTDPSLKVRGEAGVAVGDIDHDGQPEIIAIHESNTLIAFESDGTFKWKSSTILPSSFVGTNWGGVSLADINGDGTTEIIFGSQAFENDGTLLWAGGYGRGDIGLGSLSVIADIDLDGLPEIVAGSTVYRADGSLLWQNTSVGDGFNALGNFNADAYPEIVLVSAGAVYLLSHTGQVLWGPIALPGGGRGGPPTIADFDNDGWPEIGVAGAIAYTVFEADGTVKWSATTIDGSSNVTGSSVFDFDGDGRAEVIYGDELYLRIYAGLDGQELFKLPKGSGTTYELPVIVDADGNGTANIVAAANNYIFGGQTGIYMLGSADESWQATRPIWNQHSYHITNINDDGTIPAIELNSWELYNNYRRNQQITGTAIFPPTISASAPAGSSAVGSTVVLSGHGLANGTLPTGSANRIVSVELNGTAVDVLDANGNFFAAVQVLPGENSYRFTAYDAVGQTVSTEVVVTGTPASNPLDFSRYADITGSFSGVYGRTSFREGGDTLYVDLATRNDGTFATDVPLLVGIKNITDPSVRVLGADGVTPDGIAYFDFSNFVANRRLAPNESTASPTIAFHAPSRQRFGYELVFYGKLNAPPAITSIPDVEALIDKPYTYQVTATDEDNDELSYRLREAPAGMAIAAATGLITWTPATAQQGNHTIVVQVDDGRGGTAEQRYTLSVIPAPPNRPPVITSTPVTMAEVVRIDNLGNGTFDVRGSANPWLSGLPDGSTASFDDMAPAQSPSSVVGIEFIPGGILMFTAIGAVNNDPTFPFRGPDGGGLTRHLAGAQNGMADMNAPINALVGVFLDEAQPDLFPPPGALDFSASGNVLGGTDYESLAPLLRQPFYIGDGRTSSGLIQLVQIPAGARRLLLGTMDGRGWHNNGGAFEVAVSGFLQVNDPYTYTVRATDPDSDVLLYQLSTNPTGMMIDSSSGVISWAPTADQVGHHAVVVEVTDGRGGVATQEFIVCVEPDPNNHAPIITSEPVTSIYSSTLSSTGVVRDVVQWNVANGGNGHSYGVTESLMSWTDAEALALSLGAQLVSINSVAESEFVMDQFLQNEDLWIGLISPTGDWTDILTWSWVDGTSLGFQNWRPGQPDIGLSDDQDDRYGALNFVGNGLGEWDNYPNSAFRLTRAIIEFAPPLYEYDVDALDPDGDDLTYSLVDGPAGMEIDPNTGIIAWNAGLLGNNLVANGDFEQGDTGFASELRSDIWPGNPGSYRVATDPFQVYGSINPNVGSYGDHTTRTGSMMVVNGSEDPSAINWQQMVPVTPGKTYEFFAWASTTYDVAPAQLRFKINGETVGTPLIMPAAEGVWQRFYVRWNSDTATTATIQITNDQDAGLGNDFALDDIGFAEVISGSTVSVTVRVTDGRGGVDEQTFTIEVQPVGTGEIRGTVWSNPARSQFDDNLEGWSTLPSTAAQHVTSGGHSGGYLRIIDVDDSSGLIEAPATFLGNWSQLGPTGVLRYDHRIFELGTQANGFLPHEVRIAGPGGFAKWTGTTPSGTTDWSTVTVPINEGDWSVVSGTWQEIISNVTSLEIRSELVSNQSSQGDVSGIDNIALIGAELANWTIYLDQNNNGRRDVGELWTVTDTNGDYAFTGMPAGTYIVREEPQPGWQQTYPSSASSAGIVGPVPYLSVNDSQFGLSDPGSLFYVEDFEDGALNTPGVAVDGGFLGIPSQVGASIDGVDADDGAIDGIGNNHHWYTGGATSELNFYFDRLQLGNRLPTHVGIVWTDVNNSTSGRGFGSVGFEVYDAAGQSLDKLEPVTVGDGTDTWLTAEDRFIGAIHPTGIARLRVWMPDSSDWSVDHLQYGWRSEQGTGHVVFLSGNEIVSGIDFGNLQLSAGPNENPQFISPAPTAATFGSLFRYDAMATDADSDPLTYSLVTGPLGMTLNPQTGTVVWQPQEAQLGEHAVIVRVTDGRGGVAVQQYSLDVVAPNTAPLITSVPATQAVQNRPFVYEIAVQDADGELVTVALEPGSIGTLVAAEVRGPDNEPLQTRYRLEWTPSADDVAAGTRTISLRATDARGASVVQTFAVSVVATAPNVAPHINSTPRIVARPGVPYVYAVVASDANADPLTYTLDPAQHPAGMTISTAGIVTWTPSPGISGTHPVRVLVSDGTATATQEFTITIASQADNRGPAIVSNPLQTGRHDKEYVYDALAADPDGDPAAWSLDAAPIGMSIHRETGAIRWTPREDQMGTHQVVLRATDPLGASTVQSFAIEVNCANTPPLILSTPPTEGAVGETYFYGVRAIDPDGDRVTLSLASGPQGMTISPTGLIRWTPVAADNNETRSVIVRADDGDGGFVLQQFQIVVSGVTNLNRAPTITSTPVFAVTLGDDYRYQVDATDADGNTLTYALLVKPDWMTIDSATGVITGTPTAEGVESVVVEVSDGTAKTTQGFALNVRLNQAPTITSVAPTTAMVGGIYRYSVKATDPDGDPLTYSLLAGAPAGMTIDGLGRIVWNVPSDFNAGLPAGQSRLVDVNIRVSDPRGATAPQDFTITVAPDTQAPQVVLQTLVGNRSFTGNAELDLGATATIVVTAYDNVGVASLVLEIDGQMVPLDAQGRATITAETLFDKQLVAKARDAAGNEGTAHGTIRVVTSGNRNRPNVHDTTLPPHPGLVPADTQEPTVAITSPQFNASVTNLTPIIGTIDDPENNLWYWRVYTARFDQLDLTQIDLNDPDLKMIAQGTQEIHAAEIAKFDPSAFSSDPYAILVAAFDANGRGYVAATVITIEGNVKLGAFRLEFADLSIPLAGIPIEVTRVYDTHDASRQGDFGYGWTLGVKDARILEVGAIGDGGAFDPGASTFVPGKTKVYITNPAGQRVGFTYQERLVSGSFFGAVYEAYFVPDPGVYDKLTIDDPQVLRGGILGAFGEGINPDVYTLTTANGTRYRYNQHTGLQSITDSSGNVVTFTAAGIKHSSGVEVKFVRDNRGRITEIIDPAENKLLYTYNAAGDLVSVKSQAQLTTTFKYNPAQPHYLDEIIDPLGRRAVKTEYDDQGRILRTIDAAGNVVQYDHSLEGFERIRDAAGNWTALKYDNYGNVVEERRGEHVVTLPGGGEQTAYDSIVRTRYIHERDGVASPNRDKEWRVTQVYLDDLGNTLKEVTTEYDYDARGNVVKVSDVVGGQTLVREFSYDARNNVTRVKDELGRQTFFTYDAQGNLREVVNAEGHKALTTFDGQGRVTSYSDFNGNTTTFVYAGSQSQPSEIRNPGHTDAVPNVRKFEYNAFGQTTKITDEEGIVTEYRYDAQGKLTYERIGTDAPVRSIYQGTQVHKRIVARSEVEPGATDVVTEYGYYENDLLRFEIDALGAVTGYEYDANGNRTFLGRWNTKADYDADGAAKLANPAAVFAGRYPRATFEHVFVYDRLNRLDYEIDDVQLAFAELGNIPLDQLIVRLDYDYDSAGNRTEVVDRNGRKRSFEYDERNRKIAELWWQFDLTSGQEEVIRSFTWQYCTCGNVSQATEYDGPTGTSPILSRYTYTYDTLGRLKSTDNAGTKDMPHVVLTYDYDANGIQSRVTDSLGVAVVSTYDAQNRLKTRAWENQAGIDPAAAVDEVLVEFDYYRNGTQKELRRYDLDDTTGAKTLVGRTRYGNLDASGRVQTISHRDAVDQAIVEYTYGFDKLGLVKSLLYDNRDDQYDFDVAYDYDDLGQLVEADYSDATTARGIYQDEFYNYDKNGNRVSSYLHPSGYVTGAGNRLLSDGTFNYVYDNNGNLIRKTDIASGEVTVYEYDYRNLMTRATRYSQAPESGGIILAESTNRYDVDGRRIAFSTDDDGAGPNAAEETRVIHNGDDTWADFGVLGEVEARYMLGSRIDQMIAVWRNTDLPGGNLNWSLTDHLGTVRDVIDKVGMPTHHVPYESFGSPLQPVSFHATDRFLFAGREYSYGSGLYSLRARYLNSLSGRFISTDPLSFRSGEYNLYRYALNSPNNFTDPTGTTAIAQYVVILGATIGAVLSPVYYSVCQARIGQAGDITISKVIEKSVVGAVLGAVASGATAYVAFELSLVSWTSVAGVADTVLLSTLRWRVPKLGLAIGGYKIFSGDCDFVELLGVLP
jgi:RHS repeat-associated protein